MCASLCVSTDSDKLAAACCRTACRLPCAAHYARLTRLRRVSPVLGLRQQEHGQSGAALLLEGLLPEWSKGSTGRHPADQCPQRNRGNQSLSGALAPIAAAAGGLMAFMKGRPARGLGANAALALIRRRDRRPFLGWPGLWTVGSKPMAVMWKAVCLLSPPRDRLVAPIHGRMR